MRVLYTCVIRCAAPLAFAVVLWRGLRDRAYWRALGERFGFGSTLRAPTLWLHAVSLGEMSAAAPLVRELRERHPGIGMLLTTSTPAGRARAEALFGEVADVRFLPYDTPGSMRRFWDRTRPAMLIIMETELWPNLFAECARHEVPLLLANARLSEKSVSRYARLGRLFRGLFTANVLIAAQSEEDARRFAALGADPRRIHVVGNVKFDLQLDSAVIDQGRRLRALYGGARPVWIAGSTHAGEEAQLLDAHALLRQQCPEALLLLVPRHKERFNSVAQLLEGRGIEFQRRSSGAPALPSTQVILGDSVGELPALYAAADVAFVGGSLVPIGGHNLLEPAALGLPVVTGPSHSNGRDIAQLLLARGAALEVADARELAQRLGTLLKDGEARLRIGAIGRDIVASNRGSVARLLELTEPWWPAVSRSATH